MFVMSDGVLHFYDSTCEMTFIVCVKGSKTPLTIDVTTQPSESQIASILPSWTSLARSTDSGRLQLPIATLVYPTQVPSDDIDDDEPALAGPSTTASTSTAKSKSAGTTSGRSKPSTKKPPATRKRKQIGGFYLLSVIWLVECK
jgi:hypothetical protein